MRLKLAIVLFVLICVVFLCTVFTLKKPVKAEVSSVNNLKNSESSFSATGRKHLIKTQLETIYYFRNLTATEARETVGRYFTDKFQMNLFVLGYLQEHGIF